MAKYCKKCLLPNNYLNIKMDEDGVCEFCKTYKPTKYLGTEQLLKDIQPALEKNSSKKFDCVVKFSGGRDSTYLLWYIVKELHLRPLAVFSDDMFIPELVIENMKTTCKILDVELRIIQHENLKKCLPHHLKAWIKRPVPESLMFLNVGERIGYEMLPEEEAVKEGVYLIFSGRTPIQSAEQYKTDLMKLGNKGGKVRWILGFLKQSLLNPALVSNPFSLKVVWKEFNVGKWRKKLLEQNGMMVAMPFYEYVHWDEKEIERVLFEEVKWQMPDGIKNSSRWGCEVDTLRQYLFYRTLGYNDTNVDLSYMIRDGLISREDAKVKLESSVNISDDYIRYIVDKAGVDADTFFTRLDKKYPKISFKVDDVND
jgi:hypothetical protein